VASSTKKLKTKPFAMELNARYDVEDTGISTVAA
jgi:hypothetical protein